MIDYALMRAGVVALGLGLGVGYVAGWYLGWRINRRLVLLGLLLAAGIAVAAMAVGGWPRVLLLILATAGILPGTIGWGVGSLVARAQGRV
ncbi:hypothetical protein HKCCE3408_15850 [Rhodobacterales bacterium HKCCE3408]|nr:hypothetical protein [Rhodobacterales bacterium HKCCE3408]